MNELIESTGYMDSFFVQEITLDQPFADFARPFAAVKGTVVLLSGGDSDCASHHILAANPWLTLSGRENRFILNIRGKETTFDSDPFGLLKTIVRSYRMTGHDLYPPVTAGLFGYLSYDLKDRLESLYRTSVDDLHLPHLYLTAPSIVVVHHRHQNRTRLIIPKWSRKTDRTFEADYGVFQRLASVRARPDESLPVVTGEFVSNFKKSDYIQSIEKIKAYIQSGHVYQVNLSQRFTAGFTGNPYGLFQSMFEDNPAPFFSYINGGDHQVVSSSPERFVLQRKDEVETRPIKGTRPRDPSFETDQANRKDLLNSAKDAAELSMIVDLLRNDLGKVCRAGSVEVTQHKRLEAYENVYHLVSIIKGKLDGRYDSVDLIKAVFPGGSITGCPKIRAMEIIDELEPHRRHLYTGAIGYIGFHDEMDLSIAIRTAVVHDGKIVFSLGGGIVYDSDPADEFDETLHKGKTLMRAYKKEKHTAPLTRYAWVNGRIIDHNDAHIGIDDLGFLYGFGFFETIRVDRGEIRYLKPHIDRFYQAWDGLFQSDRPDLSWDEIIRQVVEKNNLQETVAAIKVIAAFGNRETPPYRHNLMVTARPYRHRLADKQEPGLNLAVYPKPRQSPLADHKTLNYLYYYMAGRWARQKGADEAVILNPDHSISETNTANLLIIRDHQVIVPQSAHVLPGIMSGRVIRVLSDRGYEVTTKRITLDDLLEKDLILAANALMGVVSVLSIDGRRSAWESDLRQTVNEQVL